MYIFGVTLEDMHENVIFHCCIVITLGMSKCSLVLRTCHFSIVPLHIVPNVPFSLFIIIMVFAIDITDEHG